MTVDTVSTSLITVDYGNSLQAMIAAGKYDWVNSGITAKRFPVEGTGTPCACRCAAFRARSAFTRPNFPGAFALGVDLPMDPEVANVFETARACSPSQ